MFVIPAQVGLGFNVGGLLVLLTIFTTGFVGAFTAILSVLSVTAKPPRPVESFVVAAMSSIFSVGTAAAWLILAPIHWLLLVPCGSLFVCVISVLKARSVLRHSASVHTIEEAGEDLTKTDLNPN